MIKINIKPLSVNQAYTGRRFKTNEYRVYQKEVLRQLPKKFIVPNGNLMIFMKTGVSSVLFDYDNAIKVFNDILQKKYKFNDVLIYKAYHQKEIVKKGQEYIQIKLINDINISFEEAIERLTCD